MAHNTTTPNVGFSLTNWVGTLLHTVRSSLWQERLYRQTYTELDSLSDRELHDIGLTRDQIGRVAREAANL